MDRPHINPNLVIRHVLLSYPVSVLWALTFFHTGRYTKALLDLLACSDADVLVIYGDIDQFTKISKYDAWLAKLRQAAGGDSTCEANSSAQGKLTEKLVPGADHFWGRGHWIREMRTTIANWLDRKPSPAPNT